LAKLEGIKIERELKALMDERVKLEKLLASDKALRQLVAGEIDADVKTYGDDRRTLIEQAERAVLTVAVVDEPVTVILSKKHWARTRQGHGLDMSSVAFKEGDGLLAAYECRTTDHCIVICSNGRVCSIPVAQLPGGRGDGVPLATQVEVANGTRIVHAFCGDAAQQLMLATDAGYGFTCAIGDMVGRNKAGKQFITVEDATILAPVFFAPTPQSLVVAVSRAGRLLVFTLAELKNLPGGGKGVIVLGLAEGDELADVAVINQPSVKITGLSGTREQHIKLDGMVLQGYFGKRARGGKSLPLKMNTVLLSIDKLD
jgi:topoisomerase-4 subunit A